MKDLWSKLLSRVSQLDVAGVHHSCGRSTSQHERCVTHRRVNKDSQRRNDKTMVKVDNEFKMNWLHEPTWREKDPSSQGPHNDSACGKQHVGVVCLVPACSGARVYQRKGREDSTSSARPVNQSKQCGIGREVPADHEAQGQVNAVTTAEVESEVTDV